MLSKGLVLDAISGRKIKIKKHIGSGGKCDIYDIALSDSKDECVLIWYNHYPSDEMYDNIKMLYENGCPSDAFLWPIEVTELYEESYGYIVRKMDNSLQSLGDILTGKASFDTYKAQVECSINLIAAFIKLYEKNLCYFVFSPDMLWVDCTTGKITLTACEMITSDGEMLYKHAYSPSLEAPEIFEGDMVPTKNSNNFSLAIMIFMMWFQGHPFEGLKSLVSCMTCERQKDIYGFGAVFVFDEENTSNKPVKSIHSNMIAQWNGTPNFIKECFARMFAHESIEDPNKRPNAQFLLETLLRYRSSLATCSCGNEVVFDNAEITCDGCNSKLNATYWLKKQEYELPLLPGKRIIGYQIGEYSNGFEAVVSIVRNPQDPTVIGIKNCSENELLVITKSGKEKSISPNEIAPLKHISQISFMGNNYEVINQ